MLSYKVTLMRTLKGKFGKWHNTHHNPFTPLLEEKKKVDDKTIIELTKSRQKEFYGISVWKDAGEVCEYCDDDRDTHNRFEAVNYDLNKSFHSEEDARDYFQTLKKKLKNYSEIKEIVEEVN